MVMRALLLILTIICSSNIHAMMLGQEKSREAIDAVVAKYARQHEPALQRSFQRAHVAYPPKNIALLAFKKEREIELWAQDNSKIWRYIRSYSLTAYSGKLGPKLKESDRQIPEGIYKFTLFNPLSHWHLSMMINYPNNFDREYALREGRKNIGGNIFMHGKASSVGCLAVGDKAIEQLFILAKRVGLKHTELIIAPNDLRKHKPATLALTQPKWLPKLYKNISLALNKFKK
jgi:murein L,D-transpeptidase YafK